MLNALDVEAVFRDADYHCWAAPYDPTILLFEDDSILGFVVLFETAEQLLSQWKEKQGRFIARMSVELRRSSRKSWNCYAVFLANEKAETDHLALLADLEEDLSLTRKLVSDHVSSVSDLQRVLMPILPIQNQISSTLLEQEGVSSRLSSWPEDARRVLETGGSATEIVELLIEAQA
jgi:hypothetical protein